MHSTLPTITSPARRRRGVYALGGALLAGGLVLAAPLAASAHVSVSPGAADAGTYTVLTFAFSHGCEESPTTAIDITIPKGVLNVAPTITAGWSITEQRDADGSVSHVVYTADTPIEGGLRSALEVQARFDASLANTTVAFPVVQTCETGSTEWTQIAADGQDRESLDSPAPTVAVGAAVAGDGHGGHDDGDGDGDHAEASSTEASAASPLAVTGVVLGAAGLVLGAGALVVALRSRRS